MFVPSSRYLSPVESRKKASFCGYFHLLSRVPGKICHGLSAFVSGTSQAKGEKFKSILCADAVHHQLKASVLDNHISK